MAHGNWKPHIPPPDAQQLEREALVDERDALRTEVEVLRSDLREAVTWLKAWEKMINLNFWDDDGRRSDEEIDRRFNRAFLK